MSTLDDLKTFFGGAQKPPEEPPAPVLDPAVVAGVTRRAMEWIRFSGFSKEPKEHALLADLDALTREAEEAVERRAPIDPGFFRGRERALPTWWRDEYANDPLLHALAARGMVASQALPLVIAAYWSIHGILMSAAMRSPPAPMVFSGDPVMAEKLKEANAEVQRLLDENERLRGARKEGGG